MSTIRLEILRQDEKINAGSDAACKAQKQIAERYNNHDQLGFLFTNKPLFFNQLSASVKPAAITANTLLSGHAPLSLLTQYFQPPEAKIIPGPITIGQTADCMTTNTPIEEGFFYENYAE